MKKQSFQRINRPLSLQGLASGVLVAIVLILALVRFLFPDFFLSAFSPVWSAGTRVAEPLSALFRGVSSSQERVRSHDALIAENESLKSEVRTLLQNRSRAEMLFGSTSESGIPADVLARPPYSPYDSLVINRGEDEQVSVGATVTASGGIPVGTISEVSKNAARVSLFSSSGRETPGWVGAARTPIILVGRGGGVFEATLPRDAVVAVDDVVVLTSARAPIASVVRIDTSPSSPSKTVQVKPFVNPFSIDSVLVLLVRGL